MKVKQCVSYQLHVFMRSAIVFYTVQLIVYLALGILSVFVLDGDMSSNGTEISMFIFVFIVGLNAFRTQFRLFLQNGMSRKTMCIGFAVSALALAVGTTVINQLFSLVCSFFMDMQPFYNVLYIMANDNSIAFKGLLWTTSMSLVLICIGFFITTLYYRMNKFGKLAFSIGFPALLSVVLPIVESMFPSLNFFSMIINAFVWIMGFGGSELNPTRAIGCFTAGSCIFLALSYLLMRKATVKDV